jgi:hypothetical protein
MGGFRVLLIFALACGMLACAAAAEQPEQPTEQPAEQPASESAVATAAAAAAAATESADAAEEAAGGPEEEEDDFDAAVETLTTLASIAARAAKGAHANLKHNNKHKGANKKHHGQAVRVHPGRKWGAPKYGKSKEADAKKQQQQHGPDHSNGSPSGPAHGKKHAPVADGKTAKLQQHKDKDSKDHSSGGYHSGAHAHGKHDGSSLGKHSHKPEVPKAPVFDIEGGEYDSTEREGMPSSKSKEGYSTAEDASKPGTCAWLVGWLQGSGAQVAPTLTSCLCVCPPLLNAFCACPVQSQQRHQAWQKPSRPELQGRRRQQLMTTSATQQQAKQMTQPTRRMTQHSSSQRSLSSRRLKVRHW